MNRPGVGRAGQWTDGTMSLASGRIHKVSDFRHLRLNLYALILIIDALSICSGFLIADLIRFGRLQGYGFATFMVMFPTYVAVGLNGDSWSIDALQRPKHSAASSARAFLFAIAVATVLFFSLKVGEDFSRLVFGIGSCVSLILITAARYIFGQAIGRRFGWSFRREVLLLDGIKTEPAGDEVVINASKEGLSPTHDDPGALDRLAGVLLRSERVIVACAPERRQAWIRALAGAGIDVEILTPELGALPAIGLRRHGSSPSLLVGCGPLPLRSRAVKRVVDLAVASASFVLFAPLMLLAAAAIRLESPGPALFTQLRVGRGNRLFTMLKFRTMQCEAADRDGDRSVDKGDDRVTRVGHFLRRTSLDELPQLINVLKGEMSIVGPRPHALGTRAEDQLLWRIDERYWDRHAIKPGLTGLAQVRGFRGATAKTSDLTDRLQSDLEYIEGWHVGRDFAIMFRTLGVLVHPNAF